MTDKYNDVLESQKLLDRFLEEDKIRKEIDILAESESVMSARVRRGSGEILPSPGGKDLL